MKEFVEKLIERLEEYPHAKYKDDYGKGFSCAINLAIKDVNQLAEEFATDINVGSKDEKLINDIKFAIEASDMNDNYTTGLINGMRYCLALIDGKEPEFEKCNQDSTKENQGWILCSERLPVTDDESEFYETVIVTNNKYRCVEFGFYDGEEWFVFNNHTTEWDKSKNIIAWQPLPEPYKPEEQEETQTNFYSERFNRVL